MRDENWKLNQVSSETSVAKLTEGLKKKITELNKPDGELLQRIARIHGKDEW